MVGGDLASFAFATALSVLKSRFTAARPVNRVCHVSFASCQARLSRTRCHRYSETRDFLRWVPLGPTFTTANSYDRRLCQAEKDARDGKGGCATDDAWRMRAVCNHGDRDNLRPMGLDSVKNERLVHHRRGGDGPPENPSAREEKSLWAGLGWAGPSLRYERPLKQTYGINFSISALVPERIVLTSVASSTVAHPYVRQRFVSD